MLNVKIRIAWFFFVFFFFFTLQWMRSHCVCSRFFYFYSFFVVVAATFDLSTEIAKIKATCWVRFEHNFSMLCCLYGRPATDLESCGFTHQNKKKNLLREFHAILERIQLDYILFGISRSDKFSNGMHEMSSEHCRRVVHTNFK